ncbi:MAG: hypothetical protein LBL34_06840 [Clostridiales bacterium]|jgi:hypothetical protein|nr:hypothetical protein [Clostridiales bacterium]
MKRFLPFLLLVIVTTFVFLVAELRYPLFFFQDDNVSQYLPNAVHAWRSLFHGGQLSFYNFHQFAGFPTLATGQSGILYPFNYIATSLSLLFTKDFYYSVDIFAYIHILGGVIGMFILINYISQKRTHTPHNPNFNACLPAFLGACIWGFSNYVWFVGNAWHSMLSIVMYTPFMIYFSLRLLDEQKFKWITLLVLTRVFYFFLGHPQFFVYSCIAEFLVMACLVRYEFKEGKNPLNFIKWYLSSYIFTLMLSLPLLLPMFHQVSVSVDRSAKMDPGLYIGPINLSGYLIGLLFPSADPETIPDFRKMAYVGIIPVIIVWAYSAKILWDKIRRKIPRKEKWLNISYFLIILYLLWTFGILAAPLYVVPILNRFRWTFKFLIFVNFFIALFSAFLLDTITSRLRGRNRILLIIILVQLVGSVYAIGFSEFYSLGNRTDTVPYSTELVEHIVDDNKLINIGFQRDGSKLPSAQHLTSNNATFFGKYYFHGYEVLLSNNQCEILLNLLHWDGVNESNADELTPIILKLREWGVKWYVTDNSYVYPLDYGFVEEYKDAERTLYSDPLAKPIFYFYRGENSVVDYEIGYNGIKISTNSQTADNLTVNFYHNPFIRGFIDGNSVDLTSTDLKQIKMSVPAGTHEIFIEYWDPYFYAGCLISGVCALIALVWLAAKSKTLRKKFRRNLDKKI